MVMWVMVVDDDRIALLMSEGKDKENPSHVLR